MVTTPHHTKYNSGTFKVYLYLFGLLVHKRLRSRMPNTSRPSSVPGVLLVCQLVAGQFDVLGINYHNIITTIVVRSKVWLMLSAENVSNLCSQTSHYLSSGINKMPQRLREFHTGHVYTNRKRNGGNFVTCDNII